MTRYKAMQDHQHRAQPQIESQARPQALRITAESLYGAGKEEKQKITRQRTRNPKRYRVCIKIYRMYLGMRDQDELIILYSR